uniref:Uncharacterized protein n=1 Tax=Timema poppense TaxID=170557 RepID=A0A7R9HAT8_TIMPO|nr:unnamed protein product [Timema poppensis]
MSESLLVVTLPRPLVLPQSGPVLESLPVVVLLLEDFEVVYQNTIGIVRGGGVEIRGLKIFHEEIIRNNEVVTKLQGVKFLPHINPRLTADVKTVSGTNSRLILSPNSSLILLITPIFNLEECVSLLNENSCFILARSFDKQSPKINHGLELILEQQFERSSSISSSPSSSLDFCRSLIISASSRVPQTVMSSSAAMYSSYVQSEDNLCHVCSSHGRVKVRGANEGAVDGPGRGFMQGPTCGSVEGRPLVVGSLGPRCWQWWEAHGRQPLRQPIK